MAKIEIKKKVILDFLGEDYKEDYLVFKSMPLRDYEGLFPKLEAAGEDGKKSIQLIREVLESNFIEGKFQGEDVTKDDLADFDIQTLTTCFETFTGQVSPKG